MGYESYLLSGLYMAVSGAKHPPIIQQNPTVTPTNSTASATSLNVFENLKKTTTGAAMSRKPKTIQRRPVSTLNSRILTHMHSAPSAYVTATIR